MLTGLVVIVLTCVALHLYQRQHVARDAMEKETAMRVASATRAGESLAIEIALRWREAVQDQPLETRRALHRVQLLAGWMDWAPTELAVARLVLALPAKTLADQRLLLPPHAREIATWRSDGAPPLKGRVLPPPAQLVGMVDFLETWQGQEVGDIREALEGEAGKHFEARLVHTVLLHLTDLEGTRPGEALPSYVVTGAVVCIHPVLPDNLAGFELALALRWLEDRARQRLRPLDRVYAADRDIVAWLPSAVEGDAERVVARLMETMAEVFIPCRHAGGVRCQISCAQVGVDGDRLPELVAAARRKAGEHVPQEEVA